MSTIEKEVTQPSLYTALQSSYGDKNATKRIVDSGYVKNDKLSDHRQQIFYNQAENKVMMNVAGTHTLKDKITDIGLGLGLLKSTKRYQSAKKTLEKAKKEYGVETATINGHSLGGAIAQKIASKQDTVNAYNSGMTIGEKARKGPGNVIRQKGDVVSMFGSGQKTQGKTKFGLGAHELGNIKKTKIYI